ncbi:cell division cycle-associated protein 2-like isoform X3 [Carassius auratus]|uniref:Cell division cycle-associated protein 2-like isoform X3 n=1 Tax=Carassius auratus TaxID=7957 RepID=A0A6P6K3E1_CARAU|nr:cell division cycle-associated protein 2-like isoform X3 [Carassius auratus]
MELTEAKDVDFSTLSPSQFGISTNSFQPSSRIKDKSRVAQLKARRRSTIGVRGSPETNSLICFRAKQAAQTPPRTPQIFEGSPFLSRGDSLKKKMAAFQSLMEEDEERDEQKKKEENESDKSTLAQDCKNGKENMLTAHSPNASMTPPPWKKRRRAPLRDCEDKITETPLPCHTFTSQPEPALKGFTSQSQRPLSDLDSDAKNELLSSPMLSKPEDESVLSSVLQKKRVRFGAPLSPEFFDRSLPPSTPLQRGGTPKHPPSSTGPKRSLLKTPQRSDPDFRSPPSRGASPVLLPHRPSDGLEPRDEVFEEIQKISFPSMEDESPSEDYAVSAEDREQPQAEDAEVMNAAFQEEEDEALKSQPSCPSGDQPLDLSAEDEQKSSVSSEQTLSFNSSIKETRSRCRKRKQAGEKEPETRRSSRTAAASASGRMMKTSGRKRGFGNKEVDRSLYGKRDFASKNPLLSPIFEKTSDSLNSTPTQPRSGKHMDGEQDCVQTPSVPQSETVHHPTVSLDTACTRTNEIQQTLSSAERGNLASKASKARRDSGRPVRKRRSSCADTRKELDSPAISSETESQEQPGCTSVCRDSPEHQETTRPVMSCKMDSINTESLNEQLTDERESSPGHTEPGLAPWQRADFSIDDILRPVSRSRGSVRRSLRNRRSVDLQAVGLAWVDHTSPELSKASRRKTRGRLSGVSEPLLSQEPAPNSPQSSVSQLTL